MMPETVIMLCVPEPDFFEELFLPVKTGKQAKNRFFEFKEKFGL